HHMYAGVPCYRLGKLHAAIKSDLPHCPRGLHEAWTEIAAILERQKAEPEYEYVPELPTPVAA
ncbi:MAG: fatty acid desaturase, partial [Gemmatimonadetes bacterium]|nr:fatty acid desaturase [Gemmatimonadota bacterium]